MIPGFLATEVAAALREFIVAGFKTGTVPFAGEFRRLVEEQQGGEAFIQPRHRCAMVRPAEPISHNFCTSLDGCIAPSCKR